MNTWRKRVEDKTWGDIIADGNLFSKGTTVAYHVPDCATLSYGRVFKDYPLPLDGEGNYNENLWPKCISVTKITESLSKDGKNFRFFDRPEIVEVSFEIIKGPVQFLYQTVSNGSDTEMIEDPMFIRALSKSLGNTKFDPKKYVEKLIVSKYKGVKGITVEEDSNCAKLSKGSGGQKDVGYTERKAFKNSTDLAPPYDTRNAEDAENTDVSIQDMRAVIDSLSIQTGFANNDGLYVRENRLASRRYKETHPDSSDSNRLEFASQMNSNSNYRKACVFSVQPSNRRICNTTPALWNIALIKHKAGDDIFIKDLLTYGLTVPPAILFINAIRDNDRKLLELVFPFLSIDESPALKAVFENPKDKTKDGEMQPGTTKASVRIGTIDVKLTSAPEDLDEDEYYDYECEYGNCASIDPNLDFEKKIETRKTNLRNTLSSLGSLVGAVVSELLADDNINGELFLFFYQKLKKLNEENRKKTEPTNAPRYHRSAYANPYYGAIGTGDLLGTALGTLGKIFNNIPLARLVIQLTIRETAGDRDISDYHLVALADPGSLEDGPDGTCILKVPGNESKVLDSRSIIKKSMSMAGATPLHFAALNPDTRILKTFLGINSMQIANNSSELPVHWTLLSSGDLVENYRTFVKFSGIPPSVTSFRMTVPIGSLAALSGNSKILYEIIHAVPTLRIEYNTSLHEKNTTMTVMEAALQSNNLDCVDQIMELRPKRRFTNLNGDWTLMSYACAFCSPEIVECLALKYKLPVVEKGGVENQPLFRALDMNNYRVVRWLINHGVNPGLVSGRLSSVAAARNANMINYLIRCGADPSKTKGVFGQGDGGRIKTLLSMPSLPVTTTFQPNGKGIGHIIISKLSFPLGSIQRPNIYTNGTDEAYKSLQGSNFSQNQNMLGNGAQTEVNMRSIFEEWTELIKNRNIDLDVCDWRGATPADTDFFPNLEPLGSNANVNLINRGFSSQFSQMGGPFGKANKVAGDDPKAVKQREIAIKRMKQFIKELEELGFNSNGFLSQEKEAQLLNSGEAKAMLYKTKVTVFEKMVVGGLSETAKFLWANGFREKLFKCLEADAARGKEEGVMEFSVFTENLLYPVTVLPFKEIKKDTPDISIFAETAAKILELGLGDAIMKIIGAPFHMVALKLLVKAQELSHNAKRAVEPVETAFFKYISDFSKLLLTTKPKQFPTIPELVMEGVDAADTEEEGNSGGICRPYSRARRRYQVSPSNVHQGLMDGVYGKCCLFKRLTLNADGELTENTQGQQVRKSYRVSSKAGGLQNSNQWYPQRQYGQPPPWGRPANQEPSESPAERKVKAAGKECTEKTLFHYLALHCKNNSLLKKIFSFILELHSSRLDALCSLITDGEHFAHSILELAGVANNIEMILVVIDSGLLDVAKYAKDADRKSYSFIHLLSTQAEPFVIKMLRSSDTKTKEVLINHIDTCGNTIFHLAAEAALTSYNFFNDLMECAQEIINGGEIPELNLSAILNRPNDFGLTPFHIFMSHFSDPSFKHVPPRFFSCGIITQRDALLRTPIHYLFTKTPRVDEKLVKEVRVELTHIKSSKDIEKSEALMDCFPTDDQKACDPTLAVSRLISYFRNTLADVLLTRDIYGWTPLHYAVMSSSAYSISTLVERVSGLPAKPLDFNGVTLYKSQKLTSSAGFNGVSLFILSLLKSNESLIRMLATAGGSLSDTAHAIPKVTVVTEPNNKELWGGDFVRAPALPLDIPKTALCDAFEKNLSGVSLAMIADASPRYILACAILSKNTGFVDFVIEDESGDFSGPIGEFGDVGAHLSHILFTSTYEGSEFSRIADHLHKAGVDFTCSALAKGNTSPLIAAAKAGATQVETAVCWMVEKFGRDVVMRELAFVDGHGMSAASVVSVSHGPKSKIDTGSPQPINAPAFAAMAAKAPTYSYGPFATTSNGFSNPFGMATGQAPAWQGANKGFNQIAGPFEGLLKKPEPEPAPTQVADKDKYMQFIEQHKTGFSQADTNAQFKEFVVALRERRLVGDSETAVEALFKKVGFSSEELADNKQLSEALGLDRNTFVTHSFTVGVGLKKVVMTTNVLLEAITSESVQTLMRSILLLNLVDPDALRTLLNKAVDGRTPFLVACDKTDHMAVLILLATADVLKTKLDLAGRVRGSHMFFFREISDGFAARASSLLLELVLLGVKEHLVTNIERVFGDEEKVLAPCLNRVPALKERLETEVFGMAVSFASQSAHQEEEAAVHKVDPEDVDEKTRSFLPATKEQIKTLACSFRRRQTEFFIKKFNALDEETRDLLRFVCRGTRYAVYHTVLGKDIPLHAHGIRVKTAAIKSACKELFYDLRVEVNTSVQRRAGDIPKTCYTVRREYGNLDGLYEDSTSEDFSSYSAALAAFEKLFKAKFGCEWREAADTQESVSASPVEGKYRLLVVHGITDVLQVSSSAGEIVSPLVQQYANGAAQNLFSFISQIAAATLLKMPKKANKDGTSENEGDNNNSGLYGTPFDMWGTGLGATWESQGNAKEASEKKNKKKKARSGSNDLYESIYQTNGPKYLEMCEKFLPTAFDIPFTPSKADPRLQMVALIACEGNAKRKTPTNLNRLRYGFANGSSELFVVQTDEEIQEAGEILDKIEALLPRYKEEAETTLSLTAKADVHGQLAELSTRFAMLIPQATHILVDSVDILKKKREELGVARDTRRADEIMFAAIEVGCAGGDWVKWLFSALSERITSYKGWNVTNTTQTHSKMPRHMGRAKMGLRSTEVAGKVTDEPFGREEMSSIALYASSSPSDIGASGYSDVVVMGIDDTLHTARAQAGWSGEHRKLLLHTTKSANLLGILANGLLIAPPDAQHTGNRLGNGVYLASCTLKSASYTNNGFSQPNSGSLKSSVTFAVEVRDSRLFENDDQFSFKGLDVASGDKSKYEGVYHPGTAPCGDKVSYSEPYYVDKNLIVPYREELQGRSCGGNAWSCAEYCVYNLSAIRLKYLAVTLCV